MKKIDEAYMFDMYMKKYMFEEQISTVEFISLLEENGVTINYVEASEGVELDMQTFGSSKLIPQDFIEQYNTIKSKGSELSYTIYGDYKSEELEVFVNEDSNVVILSASNNNIELSDLIKKNEATQAYTK